MTHRAPRRPVHVFYGGAHLFRRDAPPRMGRIALAALEDCTPDPESFGLALDLALPPDETAAIHERVKAKLVREPVEDWRIDFEDGYGYRPGPEEDTHALVAADEMASALLEGHLPFSAGIRVKPVAGPSHERGLRTLYLFLTRFAERAGGRWPDRFVVTLPKVAAPGDVSVAADALAAWERRAGVTPGLVEIEIMLETPAAVRDPLPLVQAAGGRCRAVHFGAFDYTAALGIAGTHQRLDHPACVYARQAILLALAGSSAAPGAGVWVADGVTNLLPVAVHRPKDRPLTPAEQAANSRSVTEAWGAHARNIRRSMLEGYYLSWDVHPAQLVARYAANYAFFRAGLEGMADRLARLAGQAAQAVRVGSVFDDAATARGLLAQLEEAVACGAVDEAALRGLFTARGADFDNIRTFSFAAPHAL